MAMKFCAAATRAGTNLFSFMSWAAVFVVAVDVDGPAHERRKSEDKHKKNNL